MNMRWTYLLLICVCLAQCKTHHNLDVSYSYTDQNNNVYSISSEMIAYHPISPEQSSSGTYSGGDAASAKISEETFSQISEKAEQLFASAAQNPRREMLTCVLSKRTKSNSQRIILAPSKQRSEFESMLQNSIK